MRKKRNRGLIERRRKENSRILFPLMMSEKEIKLLFLGSMIQREMKVELEKDEELSNDDLKWFRVTLTLSVSCEVRRGSRKRGN